MKASIWLAIAVMGCATTCVSTVARAGVFADDLTRCVVTSATDGDRVALMQWLFAAISTNPAIKSLSTVTDAQRQTFNKGFSRTVERLVLVDCRKQAVSALKNEGPSVIKVAFSALGEVAMRDLMAAPDTAKALNELDGFSDKEKWAALAKEAGIAAADGG